MATDLDRRDLDRRDLDRRELSELVQHWVDAGIITDQQADEIRSDRGLGQVLAEPAPAAARGSLVAEALGYLGGAIMLVALGLAAGRFWPNLSLPVRLGVAATAAALLLAAGGFVQAGRGNAPDRLRSVLSHHGRFPGDRRRGRGLADGTSGTDCGDRAVAPWC